MVTFETQKNDKIINLRIIYKSHEHLQTMTKTPLQFQNDEHKTVEGVVDTMYPLPIYDIL